MADAPKTPTETRAATEPAKAKELVVKMARGTVAKGRTVYAPTEERRIINYAPDGSPIYRFIERAFKPGQEVELVEDEILRLRIAGFLIDPDAPILQRDVGPTFERES